MGGHIDPLDRGDPCSGSWIPVAGELGQPGGGRVGGDAKNAHPTGGVLDDA